MSPDKNSENSLGELLSKYISVWIWSILFGMLSGLSYSFLSSTYRFFEWGPLNVLPAIVLSIGIVAAIQSWVSMYRYLIYYIVPRFVSNAKVGVNSEGNESDTTRDMKAIQWLRQAFLMMIIGTAMRLGLEVIILIFITLQ